MGSAFELLNSGNTHRVKQAEIDGKRLTQKSANEKEAASASLSRFSQSLSNKRKLDAAGAEFTASEQNIRQALDQSMVGNFQQRLQAAADLGSASVQAAAAGVGGGSVEAYNRTLSLSNAIQEEANTTAASRDALSATANKSNIIKNAVASLGSDSYQGNFDYTVYLDHVKQKNVLGAFALAATATYFGGPRAGMAVTDAVAASNRFSNNDTSGGGQLLSSAFSNGLSAFKTANSTAGPTAQQGPALSSTPQASRVSTQVPGFFQRAAQSLNFNIK